MKVAEYSICLRYARLKSFHLILEEEFELTAFYADIVSLASLVLLQIVAMEEPHVVKRI